MNGKGAKALAALTLVMAVATPADPIAQSVGPREPTKSAPVILHADNENWLEVRIYAIRNGNIYDRIGTLRSFSSKDFELPKWVTATTGQLQLAVAPIGSRQRYTAPPVIVTAGDIVEWRLGYSLANSTISVRTG